MDFTEQIKDVNCHKYGPIMIIGLSQFSIKKILFFFIYISVFTNRGTTAPVWWFSSLSRPWL